MMLSLFVAVVVSQITSFHDSNGTYMLRAGTGGVVIYGAGEKVLQIRNGKGDTIAWIDESGAYHRAGGEPQFYIERPADLGAAKAVLEATHVRSVIAALPYPPRGFRTTDAIGVGLVGGFVTVAVGLVAWALGLRWLLAVLLIRPLRRFGKWLDRGPRQHEADVLRFKRDLNRTIEQLESERR